MSQQNISVYQPIQCHNPEDHSLNPLNAELNPICHLLALLGGATIVVVSRLRVNMNCHRSLKYALNQ